MAQAKPVTQYTARLELPGTLISEYILKAPEGKQAKEARELIILLHGYMFTARSTFDWLQEVLPKDAAIFVPNGPYPVPERVEGGFRPGFSWYFYDSAADQYLIDEKNSVGFIAQAVSKLGLVSLPKRVIGYSQGGYLSSHVATALTEVRQVIGIACRFHEEDIQGVPSYRLDAVHGEKDDVVDFEPSRASHRALIARGARGEFFSDPASGHWRTPAMTELVKKALLLG